MLKQTMLASLPNGFDCGRMSRDEHQTACSLSRSLAPSHWHVDGPEGRGD